MTTVVSVGITDGRLRLVPPSSLVCLGSIVGSGPSVQILDISRISPGHWVGGHELESGGIVQQSLEKTQGANVALRTLVSEENAR